MKVGTAVAAATLAYGCGNERGHHSLAQSHAGTRAAFAIHSPEDCSTTLPQREGPRGVPRAAFFGWDSSYGNGKLWVGGLWPGGVIAAGPPLVTASGAVAIKLGWWRNVTGDLRITGQHLGPPRDALRTIVPRGYGRVGFQSTGVSFPTPGCWRITGRVGTAKLTFVAFVVKQRRMTVLPPG